MKKLIAILLLVALCVGLVACTQSEAESTDTSTQATTQPTSGGSVSPVSGNTPTLSSGSGCAGDTSGGSE